MKRQYRTRWSDSNERRITLSVVVLESERNELAAWAADARVSMSEYIRMLIQHESVQQQARISDDAPNWMRLPARP